MTWATARRCDGRKLRPGQEEPDHSCLMSASHLRCIWQNRGVLFDGRQPPAEAERQPRSDPTHKWRQSPPAGRTGSGACRTLCVSCLTRQGWSLQAPRLSKLKHRESCLSWRGRLSRTAITGPLLSVSETMLGYRLCGCRLLWLTRRAFSTPQPTGR
jgi:hypothetical protein